MSILTIMYVLSATAVTIIILKMLTAQSDTAFLSTTTKGITVWLSYCLSALRTSIMKMKDRFIWITSNSITTP